jgi:type III secretion protein R
MLALAHLPARLAEVAPKAASLVGDRPLEMLLVLGALALVPVALVMLTSFVKIAVVLSVARSALGAPQVPPSSVVTGLALLLSMYVMAPVAEQCWAGMKGVTRDSEVDAILDSTTRAAEPLRSFLIRFGRPDDRQMFADLARRLRKPESRSQVGERDYAVIAPAFVISELRRAFTIGFLVFIPFLAVDLIISNVLLALGLTQLSPTTVALPFKLLLFVAVDGWKLLAKGLALGYLQ